MSENNQTNVKPSIEDKQQLDMLSQEINQRLEEFGNVIFKNLTKKSGYKFSKVSFERSEKGYMAEAIVITDDPDDEMTIGYYCDPPGVCQTTPCG